jgi:hypothetical protein
MQIKPNGKCNFVADLKKETRNFNAFPAAKRICLISIISPVISRKVGRAGRTMAAVY